MQNKIIFIVYQTNILYNDSMFNKQQRKFSNMASLTKITPCGWDYSNKLRKSSTLSLFTYQDNNNVL